MRLRVSANRRFLTYEDGTPFFYLGDTAWELFSTLAFQSSSFETSETLNVITTSGHFRGEVGLWWTRTLTERVSWGLVGSAGVVGFSQAVSQRDLTATSRDEFRNRFKLGLTTRQEEGAFKGSFAEWSYVRDPLFRYQDRLYRFGGEEFVVLMRCDEEAHAGEAFERLRLNTERYAFPQVGRITVSIGFTEVRAGDAPAASRHRRANWPMMPRPRHCRACSVASVAAPPGRRAARPALCCEAQRRARTDKAEQAQ